MNALRVTHVAILLDGQAYSLPAPNRHHDVIHLMVHEHNLPTPVIGEQGFLLEDGTFAGRVLAARNAIGSGQIERLEQPPRLFSEDLW